MTNHLRCPLCGRNVRYSNIARKVVRHKQIETYEEPLYLIPGLVVNVERTRLTRWCPVGGMKEGEVRRLKRTVEAFRDQS